MKEKRALDDINRGIMRWTLLFPSFAIFLPILGVVAAPIGPNGPCSDVSHQSRPSIRFPSACSH